MPIVQNFIKETRIKLDNLSDVMSFSPAINSLLQFNGKQWIPKIVSTSLISFPRNHIAGLIPNVGINPFADIDVSPGECRSSDNTENMTLEATLTKYLTASWLEGNNQGGLDTGIKTAFTLYAVWLIKNIISGVVDILFSTSFSSPVMPLGYTKKRLIGAFKTTSIISFIIAPFKQVGDEFTFLNVDAEDFTEIAPAGVNTRTLLVPPNCLANFAIEIFHFAGLSNLPELYLAMGNADSVLTPFVARSYINVGIGAFSILGTVSVNSSSQIKYQILQAGGFPDIFIRFFVTGFTMLTRSNPI